MRDLVFRHRPIPDRDWILPALSGPAGRATIEDVIARTAAAAGVRAADLVGRSQERRYSWPRQCAMFLCREMGLGSLALIGAAMGGRDHTTVLSAVEAVKARMSAELRAALDEIARDVRAGRVPKGVQ